jgi:AP endonuclease-2
VEGLLEELKADILCFQGDSPTLIALTSEHKTRRQQLDRGMACPGSYDAFWTFPRSKLGYSGVCTYVDSRVCVPLRAEEGITGLLLSESGGIMKPPWTAEEKIGCYPDLDNIEIDDEVDGTPFNPRTLDVEGRAVVLDFG